MYRLLEFLLAQDISVTLKFCVEREVFLLGKIDFMKIQRFIICGAIFSSAKHKLSQKTHVAKPEDDFAQGPRRREESLRCSVFFIEVLRFFVFF